MASKEHEQGGVWQELKRGWGGQAVEDTVSQSKDHSFMQGYMGPTQRVWNREHDLPSVLVFSIAPSGFCVQSRRGARAREGDPGQFPETEEQRQHVDEAQH